MDSFMVIMFAGKAGAGKDTAASIVQEILPNASCYAFAQKVKEIARDCYGWDGVKDEKGRRLLQDIGRTGRAYDPQFWVKDCIGRISQCSGLAIVTDLRFRNEMDSVKNAFPGTKVVLVRGRAADLGCNSSDVSEHDLDGFSDFDYVLDNSGTIEELKSQIASMIEKFAIA